MNFFRWLRTATTGLQNLFPSWLQGKRAKKAWRASRSSSSKWQSRFFSLEMRERLAAILGMGHGIGSLTGGGNRARLSILGLEDRVTPAAPTLLVNPTTQTFTEDAPAKLIASASTIVDADDDVVLLQAQITGNFVPTEDVLSMDSVPGLSASFNAATGQLTIATPGGTPASDELFTQGLQAIRYVNTNTGNPSGATRTVQFSVTDTTLNDGDATSVTSSQSLQVQPLNDAPTVAAPASLLKVAVNKTLPVAGLSVADVDAAGGAITVSLGVTAGTLTVRNDVVGGLAAGDIATNNTASVTLTGTLTSINATLSAANGVTFTHSAVAPTVTLTIGANDGGNTGDGGALSAVPATLTINVLGQPTTVYVDPAFASMTQGTDPAGPAVGIGYDAFAAIQDAIGAVATGGTVNVAAGTYNEDVIANVDGLKLLGAGPNLSVISGPIGGVSTTVGISASNVEVAGFTITRAGNNTTDWNNPNLNSAGIAIQGQALTGALIHDNLITGMRTGIDINNSNGHTVRDNVITNNHTGFILRNQTDNLVVTENAITANRTVGVLFLDGSGGTNSPLQQSANSRFFNNDISGNWYGQVVDRQTGGSIPAAGTNVKDFSGNWFGTGSPIITTANSAESGYAALIPTVFGGTATAPGGQPDVAGPASANFDLAPWLNSGTDTSAAYGFQGNFASQTITTIGTQAGTAGRLQEGIDIASASPRTLIVRGGAYVGGADATAAGRDVTLDTVGATGTPGTGVVDLTGNLALNAGDTLRVQLNGLTAGTGYDQINVTGTANITAATLTVARGFTPTPGAVFTILTATGGVSGTFAGYAEGATITLSDLPFTIHYAANAVTLSLVRPTQVWVNDNFTEEADTSGGGAGLQAGDTVGGDGVTGKIFGYNAFASVQAGVDAAAASGTVTILAGTYVEDVTITTPNLTLRGDGTTAVYAPTGVVGPAAVLKGAKNGSATTLTIQANGVVVDGLTITRDGNTAADWNDASGALNAYGVLFYTSLTDATLRNSLVTGNRNGVYTESASGIKILNNTIDNNRTGIQVVNSLTNLRIEQNFITNNWTLGILFRTETSSTPLSVSVRNNAITGNWYGGIVNRSDTTSVIDVSGNWFGTNAPTTSTTNTTEEGYATQVPAIFPGGTKTNPGGTPDIVDVGGLTHLDFSPWLNIGTDTDTATYGFQGNFSDLTVTPDGAQAGTDSRITEAVGLLTGTNPRLLVNAGTYAGSATIDKTLRLESTAGTIAIDSLTVGNATTPTSITLLSSITASATAGNVSLTGTGTSVSGATFALSLAATGSVTADAAVTAASLSLTGGNVGGTGAITTTGGVTVTSTGTGTLSGVIAGANSPFVKTGAGTLTLTGANTYTGATTVNSGRLNVNGSVTSNVTVNASGTLGSSGGTITGDVTGAGKVAPGNSVGTMTITGNFTPTGTVEFEVDTAASYDVLNVNGLVNLSGATLTLLDPDTGTPIVAAALPGLFTLIHNDLADATTASTSSPNVEGAVVTINGTNFRLFYNGGDGNDVVLVNAAAPATVYVDAALAGTNGGSVVDIDPTTAGTQPGIFGVNAFATISEAVNAVAAGGTVIVRAGTYANAAAVTINKSISLLADAGVAVSAPGSNNVFVVAATNVTISGFAIQVDQRTPSGQRGNPFAAIYGNTFDGLKLLNNTFTAVVTEARAVYLSDTVLTQGVTIQGNTFTADISTTANFYYRTVELLGLQRALVGGPTAAEGNTFNYGRASDLHLNFLSAGTNVLVQNNRFNEGGVNVTEPNGTGSITISQNAFAQGANATQSLFLNHLYNGHTVTVSDNTFVTRTVSVVLADSTNVNLTGNTFSVATGLTTAYAHFISDTQIRAGDQFGTFVPVSFALQGNTFNGSATATGTAVSFYNGNSNGVTNTSPASAPTYGSVTLGGTGAAANTFSGPFASFIQLNSGLNPYWGPTGAPTGGAVIGPVVANFNSSENLFDVTGTAKRPAAMSLAELFGLEDKIVHKVDVGTLGFVTVVPNNVYVTPASGSIQRGVDAASAGFTVNVAPGAFTENVVVNKSVTLLGAQTGVDARTRPGTGETVVVTNGNQNSVFAVTANAVTIDGFTIDGDDPSLAGSATFSGADSNTAYGVTNRAPGAVQISGLHVTNNVIRNVGVGVRLDGVTGVSAGSTISQNWFHDIGNYDFGYAVSLRTNCYADVTDNLMTKVWTGVHTNNFNGAGGPGSWTVSGNEVHSYAGGLLYWLQYNGATGLTVDNNQFSAEVGAVADNFGVLVVSIQDAVNPTFTRNTITGTAYGIGLFNVPTSNTITLGATNAITGTTTAGVLLTNNLNFNPVGTTNFLAGGPGAASTVILDGLPVTTAAGDGVLVNATGGTATRLVVRGAVIRDSGTSDSGIETVGALAAVNVLNAQINGFDNGVNVPVGTAEVHGSDLSGNAVAVRNASGNTVAATGNWWGVATQSGIVALIVNAGAGSATTYNPWLGAGDASPSTTGFQADYGTLTAIPTDEEHATSDAGYTQPISTVGTVTVLTGNTSPAVGTPYTLTSGATVTLNADGTFTYDPNSAFESLAVGETATDSFTYRFTDANGVAQDATITLSILGTNDAPTIAVDSPVVTVNEGTTATNTGTFGDADSTDVVTLTASIGTVIDNGDGTWSWSYLATDDISGLVVTITATDDSGEANNTASVTFVLNATNVAPIVQSPLTLSATTIGEGGAVTVSGTVTDAGTADTQTVTIIWGDGTPNTVLPVASLTLVSPGTYTFSATHTYADDPAGTPDQYTISVTSVDNDGATSTAVTAAVTVNNVAPAVAIAQGASSSGLEGTAVTFTGLFTDPGAGEDVNFTYTWTVTSTNGQGVPNGTGTVTTYTVGGTAVPAFTFTPADDGTYTISLTVTDKDGGTSVAATHTLTVTNVAPTLSIVTSGVTSYTEGDTAGVLLLASASITDVGLNDTITIATVTLSTSFVAGDQLGINLGSGFATAGTLPSGVTFAYDGAGSLTLSGAASRAQYAQDLALVRYRSTSAVPTGDGSLVNRTVTFTVSDNGPTPNASTSVSRILTVIAINQAPVITIPAAIQFVNEDSTGGALVFSTANGNAISVVDVDAGSNSVLVVLSVTNSTLTLGSLTGLTFDLGDGTADANMVFRGTIAQVNAALAGLTFAPNANYNGLASLAITVNDEGNFGSDGPKSDSKSVPIVVNPVPDAPVANPDAGAVSEDGTLTATGNVLTNDTDADGDALTVTAGNFAGTYGSLTLTANGSWLYALNNSSPAVQALKAGQTVTDVFTYVVDDGQGGTGTGTLTITVTGANDAPTATNDAPTVLEDGSVTVNVLTNDLDADGDPLTVVAVGTAQNGTVTFTGTTVTYTPNANYNGPDSFTYTISDGQGGTATATVNVTVTPVNDAPVAVGDSATVSQDGGAVTINVLSNDSDPEGQALTITGVSQPANGTVTISGSGVAYTPNGTFVGVDTFTYTVSDGNGGTATATVAVTVTETIEVLPPVPPSALLGDTQYSVGAGAGGAPVVQTYDQLSKTPTSTITAYDATFTGGVRTASGDVNGDGVADTITITGPGTAVNLKVFDGVTGKVILNTFPFETSFTGGGYVAVGDFNRDGKADIVVSADEGGGPRVRIFDGLTGNTLTDFFGIDDPNFRGGARVAVADMNGDGWVDLLVGAGFGGGPRVAGYSGKTIVGNATPDRLFGDFFAYELTLRNGVFLTAGDINGDGLADLIVGGGPGGGPRVRIFSGAVLTGPSATNLPDSAQIANFFAGDTSNRGGVRLAVKDLDNDNFADLVTGTGDGAGSLVQIALGKDILAAPSDPLFASEFDAFSPLAGGIYVG
ncbi:beta strand repeat-containing protein [Limnoglobus roseus]|uniref:Putative beta-solenoid-type carbohydrate-active enzyme n=1 Tax=Limnoglobus roseus TaxID=2598579 RepID=A0A5C1AK54_9BACT|nr:tandem-95 repeat protein [Limnoglobus roseus]QEL18583.1 putative beta-solenoid-type carbohydrate-active enzyme [Limnoglobus roseus]